MRILTSSSGTLSRYLGVPLIILFAIAAGQSYAQGTWIPVTTPAPALNGGVMLLLSDGSVMAKTRSGTTVGDTIGNVWNRLIPDIHGSYANGTWTTPAPMHYTRLYFSSQVLKDGRVYIAGGEYGTGGALAEMYDPLTDIWTMTQNPGKSILDANSEMLPDGRVLQAFVTGNQTSTAIFDPVTNTYTAGPDTHGSYDESSWVKLRDSSILYVDINSRNAERYIPSLNKWLVDATVPVSLYDIYGEEAGAGFLLSDGRAFFIGATGHTAYYLPSGNSSPGTWTIGPDVPRGQGTPDAPAAMMVNGKILCAVSPVPTNKDSVFQKPTTFYEFNYLTNSFSQINAPGGGTSLNFPSSQSIMLDLPDGTVLYGKDHSSQYYIYQPDSIPLAAGKPTISTVTQDVCGVATIIGTLFNGISEGAAYGDDWQMATNYPIVRLTSGTNVYYARTFNWNSTGVQQGNAPDTAQFTLPSGIPGGTYALVVIANGISSDSVMFTPAAVQTALTSTINPPAICSNTTFTYVPTSNDANVTFTWTRAAVTGISNAAVTVPQSVNPNETLINTTPYPVKVAYTYTIAGSSCSAVQHVIAVVNPSQVVISGNSSICAGDSTTLTGIGGTDYVWSTGATTSSITVSASGTYTVTTTSNSYGCSVGVSTQIVTVNSLPAKPQIIRKSNNNLQCTGAHTYQWFLNGQPIPGATKEIYVAVANGVYRVKITNTNGCANISDTVNINTVATGIAPRPFDQSAGVRIFPNPTDSKINIWFTEQKTGRLILYDLYGKLLRSMTVEGKQTQLDLTGLPPSVYVIFFDNSATHQAIGRISKIN